MLPNQTALKKLLDFYNNFTDQNDLGGIADINFNILATTNAVAKIYQRSITNLINSNLAEIAVSKDLISQLLSKLINDKKEIQTISINFLRIDGYKALLVHYKPIVNNDTGDVIAIQGKLNKLEHPFSWYNISNLIVNERTNNGVYSRQQDDLLSNIELEILFLLFNCDSYKDIADILRIAHGKIYTQDYVGKIIRRTLMQKLKAYNVTTLKKKAIELGYHKKVPLSLLGEMIVEIDKI